MGKWLEAFKDESEKTGVLPTDNIDTMETMSTLSVDKSGVFDRWNPELAAQDYHWCYDCRYFDQTCTHPDNPFRKQCPQAPRKCQWYEDNHLEYT